MADRPTLRVYERDGRRWSRRRPPLPHLVTLARWVDAEAAAGPRVDLGCGTGGYLPALGSPVVALDAASAMLQALPARHPPAWPVRADLEALPFRRGTLAGAWARASYLHVPPARLALALAHLHHALVPGAPFAGTVTEGAPGWRALEGDDCPGRRFAFWAAPDLAETLEGAGFRVEDLRGDGEWLTLRARRAVTLPDYVAPGLRLLVVGINPSPRAAPTGVPFSGPGNRFWAAARLAGLVPPGADRDPWAALGSGTGFTDLVKRPTPRAADLRPEELRDGAGRLERVVRRHRPAAVCIAGLGVARRILGATGPGPARTLGGRPAYVMPNPSGANAATRLEVLVEHLRRAAGSGR